MGKKPWYHAGLAFECTGCGDCCTGAPGYVWVNKAEIEAMAKLVGEPDIDKFEQLYVRKVGIRKSLKELSNDDCVFFDSTERNCRVYDARPRQCRTWPFWDSNLHSPEHWESACETCPGSGKGKVYQLSEIEERRNEFHV